MQVRWLDIERFAVGKQISCGIFEVASKLRMLGSELLWLRHWHARWPHQSVQRVLELGKHAFERIHVKAPSR